MFKVLRPGICLLLLPISVGCGNSKKDGPQSGEAKVTRAQSLIDDFVSAINSSADKLDKVVDKASAKSASEELAKSSKRLREIARDLKSLGKLTEAEQAQLSVKGSQTAMNNLTKANKEVLARIQEGTVPPEANEALNEAYLDFSKASMEINEALKAMGAEPR
jgi:hypothetical protein